MPGTDIIVFDAEGLLAGRLAALLAEDVALPARLRPVRTWPEYSAALDSACDPIVFLDGKLAGESLQRLVTAAQRRFAALIAVVAPRGAGPMLELRLLGLGCVLDAHLPWPQWHSFLQRAVAEQQRRLADSGAAAGLAPPTKPETIVGAGAATKTDDEAPLTGPSARPADGFNPID